jgi:hypothetical protein
MASKLERLRESDDPGLAELRRQLADVKPHQPKPGDPDYQTPKQVARILRELRENNDDRETSIPCATRRTRRR